MLTTKLTPREEEVYQLLLKGFNKPQIAKMLFLETCTVATHTSNIFLKKECNSIGELLAGRINELEKTISTMNTIRNTAR